VLRDSVLADVYKCQSYQAIGSAPVGALDLEPIDYGIASFRGGAHVHDVLEEPGVSWYGRKQPWIFLGSDVDERTKKALREAIALPWTVLGVKDIEGFSEPVGVSLCGAAEDMYVPFLVEGMMAK